MVSLRALLSLSLSLSSFLVFCLIPNQSEEEREVGKLESGRGKNAEEEKERREEHRERERENMEERRKSGGSTPEPLSDSDGEVSRNSLLFLHAHATHNLTQD